MATGSALAAAGGALAAHVAAVATPDLFAPDVVALPLLAALLAGRGSALGAVVAAVDHRAWSATWCSPTSAGGAPRRPPRWRWRSSGWRWWPACCPGARGGAPAAGRRHRPRGALAVRRRAIRWRGADGRGPRRPSRSADAGARPVHERARRRGARAGGTQRRGQEQPAGPRSRRVRRSVSLDRPRGRRPAAAGRRRFRGVHGGRDTAPRARARPGATRGRRSAWPRNGAPRLGLDARRRRRSAPTSAPAAAAWSSWPACSCAGLRCSSATSRWRGSTRRREQQRSRCCAPRRRQA